MKKTYVLWNPEKVAMAGYSGETYEGLLEAERQENASISSLVEVDDIKPILTAIYNETDISLKCHELIVTA
ncbi:TPA: hypothetical protein I7297_14535 [Vibrio parahaemolyticus]|nr:hypothetical protein [Vibrio parahaemolyticus]